MAFHTRAVLHVLGGVSALALTSVVSTAQAQVAAPRTNIDLPAQSLDQSVQAVGVATHRNILTDDAVLSGKQAPAIRGSFTAEEALKALLAHSNLVYSLVGDALVIKRAPPGGAGSATTDITVTGSKIRGAEPTSIIISTDRQTMEDSGLATLSDFARSIPQSFGGGVNIGVGQNVPSTSGVDTGGTSTVNLRGLGSDATLTLLNGHRAAYSGYRQGIDISMIPLGMVDKVEVVPDGSSALYGSDAVGGVVNVILRKNFDGLETRAEIGGATDGGGFRQQYGAVAGKQWSSGGMVVGYEYLSTDALYSDQRDYTKSNPGVSLLPKQNRHAIVANGEQQLADGLTFAIDAVFNRRENNATSATNAAGDLSVSRTEKLTTNRSLVLAPSLKFDLGHAWQATLSGVYGSERMWLVGDSYTGTTLSSTNTVCYCNTLASVEVNGDGPLFALAGGDARLAVGAGYRYNYMHAFRTDGVIDIRAKQDSYYAYGEINLPFVSAAQRMWGVHRFELKGAVRGEHYPGTASVATPTLGLIYAPVADLTVKANWGRSFKAPTLYQLYSPSYAFLYNSTSLGGTSGTALYLTGGNPNLKPERAHTWSTTLEFRPHQIPGLDLQVSYFSVLYLDRIVTPITYTSQSLSNASYSDYVTDSPSTSAVEEALANSALFYNYASTAYDASAVTAIVNNLYVNAGRQTIRGLDILARYRRDLGDLGTLNLAVNAAYLDSKQQLTAQAAVTQLAGTLFNPPHWRARASATWNTQGATFNATVSRTGGLIDARYDPVEKIHGMTTLDLTARYAFESAHGPLSGLSLKLSAQNILNAQPDRITAKNYYDTPFDTTNYSALGRFLSIGFAKTW